MERDELLVRIKHRLEAAYGDRLRGVILYGSEARHEATDESDFDILVLLEGPVAFGLELRRIVEALYGLQLESPRIIEALPVDSSRFEEQRQPLFRHAREEGIAL